MSEFLIRVTPRAGRNEVALAPDGSLIVRVTAPPADGEANKAVIETVAKRLGIAKSRVQIVAGGSSRTKRLAVDGLSAEEALARIAGG